MNLLTGIGVYFLIWWTTLFAVLPWGNAPDEEFQQGNTSSAPKKPRLLLKFAVNTLISGIIWTILFFILQFNEITL